MSALNVWPAGHDYHALPARSSTRSRPPGSFNSAHTSPTFKNEPASPSSRSFDEARTSHYSTTSATGGPFDEQLYSVYQPRSNTNAPPPIQPNSVSFLSPLKSEFDTKDHLASGTRRSSQHITSPTPGILPVTGKGSQDPALRPWSDATLLIEKGGQQFKARRPWYTTLKARVLIFLFMLCVLALAVGLALGLTRGKKTSSPNSTIGAQSDDVASIVTTSVNSLASVQSSTQSTSPIKTSTLNTPSTSFIQPVVSTATQGTNGVLTTTQERTPTPSPTPAPTSIEGAYLSTGQLFTSTVPSDPNQQLFTCHTYTVTDGINGRTCQNVATDLNINLQALLDQNPLSCYNNGADVLWPNTVLTFCI